MPKYVTMIFKWRSYISGAPGHRWYTWTEKGLPPLYPKINHNRLGLGDLVPPNFNLVASMTLTILPLSAFPSWPIKILVTASLPGPKSLKTNSKA